MFQNQNKEKATMMRDLSQSKDLKIDDIPIHTMAKDLEEIKNPTKFRSEEKKHETKSSASENLTEKQKTSPFLMPVEEPVKQPSTPEKTAHLEKKKTIADKKIKSAPIDKPGETGSNKSLKIVSATVIVLVILIIGTGGYYFFAGKKYSSPAPPQTNEPNKQGTSTASEQHQAADKPAKTALSSENPNYLPIDTTSDQTGIKKTIRNYADKVKSSGISAPVEFVITDQQNNPLDFSVFASLAGISLSKTTLSDLNKTFSLFIYNDNSNMGVGLAVNTKNATKLRADLLGEEANLNKELQAILLPDNYVLPSIPFQKSLYKNSIIRYQNIISKYALSIDYTVTDSQFLIGTTEATLEAMIDKLSDSKTNTQTPATQSTSAAQPSAQTAPVGLK